MKVLSELFVSLSLTFFLFVFNVLDLSPIQRLKRSPLNLQAAGMGLVYIYMYIDIVLLRGYFF